MYANIVTSVIASGKSYTVINCLNFASIEITPEKFCYAGVLFLLCLFWFACLLDLYALILDFFEYVLVYRYCSEDLGKI